MGKIIFLIIKMKDKLFREQHLYPGQQIKSKDGRYFLQYQEDGNLVIYTEENNPIWSSETGGTSAGSVVHQLDGNIVVYDADNVGVWSTETCGQESYKLVMKKNGNLKLYDDQGNALWSSDTKDKM